MWGISWLSEQLSAAPELAVSLHGVNRATIYILFWDWSRWTVVIRVWRFTTPRSVRLTTWVTGVRIVTIVSLALNTAGAAPLCMWVPRCSVGGRTHPTVAITPRVFSHVLLWNKHQCFRNRQLCWLITIYRRMKKLPNGCASVSRWHILYIQFNWIYLL